MTSPLTLKSSVAVGADSNIVRKRSSVSRRSEVVESDRCASASGAMTAGRSHGLVIANVPTASPSAAITNSTPKPEAEKSPVSRMLCPRPSRSMTASRMWLTPTKTAAAARPESGEAEIAVLADCVDGEPGRETAERDVRDVERLDVPRVPVANGERDVQRDHERDDEERRQDERSRDHERRRGVDAVVPADRDAEQRRDRGEREQDREGQPLGLRRVVSHDDGDRDATTAARATSAA